MDKLEVFKSMEKDLEERHLHKIVAIHKGKVISKKPRIVGVDLHPKLDIDCPVGRNLFGEIDVQLLGKSGRLVLDLEVMEGER